MSTTILPEHIHYRLYRAVQALGADDGLLPVHRPSKFSIATVAHFANRMLTFLNPQFHDQITNDVRENDGESFERDGWQLTRYEHASSSECWSHRQEGPGFCGGCEVQIDFPEIEAKRVLDLMERAAREVQFS
jgi:hypothetical protein